MAEKRQQINDTDNTGYLSEAISIARTPANDKNAKQTYTTEHSGWYYDQQLIQPLTSVRLLSNTLADWKDDHWEFSPISGDKYENLLASSILAEDFSIEVNNNWVDNGVDDIIGGTLNTFKNASPYVGMIHKALQSMSQSQQESGKPEAAEKSGLKVTKGVTSVVDYFGSGHGSDLIREARRAANGHFVSQGCSFTYYNGTGVNFNNLGMKFTIFPTFASDGTWKSVMEQVSLLFPYCIGILQDIPTGLKDAAEVVLNDVTSKVSTSLSNFMNSVINTVGNSSTGQTVGEKINHYIKWQSAPGGYDLDKPENIDAVFPGTLSLEIGTHYKIESLVISGLSLQFSKQMVKHPGYFGFDKQYKNKEESMSPLYCDVNLMLRPITKYSSSALLKFIYGNVDSRKTSAANILDFLKSKIDQK